MEGKACTSYLLEAREQFCIRDRELSILYSMLNNHL